MLIKYIFEMFFSLLLFILVVAYLYLELGRKDLREGLLSTSPGTLYQIRAVGVENKHLYAHSKDAIPSLSAGYPDYYWGYTPFGHSRKNNENLSYYQARMSGDGGI
jgi:hypothetical protein